MPAPQKIIDLVKRFKEHKDSYLAVGSGYNETKVRQEFINPLFKELGWDVSNEKGYSEKYKDVIHEDKVSVNHRTKAPDYSFCIGGKRIFFVEAKKPAVDIKNNADAAFQTRSYGWSAQMSISILTNFNEFVIYNTRVRPKQNDSAGIARVKIYKYTDYVDKWDEIESQFSKDAILTGKFDKSIAKQSRGTETIDRVFLTEIEQWREHLAKDIYKNNPKISARDLNTAVQLIIDRIIFLRICEDRGIESENKLQDISTKSRVYESLKNLFTDADAAYNSGLFHFNIEKGQSSKPDKLTPPLSISDSILQNIIKSLYHPSPYKFLYLPADILGQIYERFLGKVIRLTPKQVKVEDKPEVRKAGGVYYTPSHIVDYIIEHTLKDLLDDSTPDEVAKIRVLDPACGSGSFLIVAYQYLLDWHLEYYLDHPQESKNKIVKIVKKEQEVWQLSIAERKNILSNNIFGVDIDAQAVEVTKLSLLLKVLEGGNKETIKREQQLKLLTERILPDLGSNIKCGNSLISTDFYTTQRDLDELLDDDERHRINVFDWENTDGFPKIMKSGGFNAIIGNPPYIFARNKGFKSYETIYYNDNFQLQGPQLNTFPMFVELSCKLLKKNGRFGYIIPNRWLMNGDLELFRNHIISETGNLHIVNYNYNVFAGTGVDTSTLIFEKTKPSVAKMSKSPEQGKINSVVVCDQQALVGRKSIPFYETFLEAEPTLQRINKFNPLGDYTIVKCGLTAYGAQKGTPPQTEMITKGRQYHSRKKEDKTYRKYLDKNDVARFKINWTGQWLKYGRNLASPAKEHLFEGERILVRQILDKMPYSIPASIVNDNYLNDRNSMIIQVKCNHNMNVILGLLNSKIISFWVFATYQKLESSTFPQLKIGELASIPMALDTSVADEIADKVGFLTKLLKNIGKKPNATIKTKIKQLNDELDALAYQAYGMNDEDIAIIEKTISLGKKTPSP